MMNNRDSKCLFWSCTTRPTINHSWNWTDPLLKYRSIYKRFFLRTQYFNITRKSSCHVSNGTVSPDVCTNFCSIISRIDTEFLYSARLLPRRTITSRYYNRFFKSIACGKFDMVLKFFLSLSIMQKSGC